MLPMTGGPESITVWLVDPAILDGAAERALALTCLSDTEAEHAATIDLPLARNEFLAARMLARVALASCLGIPPQRIEFVRGVAGKPKIGAPRAEPAVRFNLSHTRGLVACAVTRIGDIGVDVEEVRAVPLDVAETLFAPPEIEALRALPSDERQEAAAVLWTLKEAFVKARGDGLSLPLDAFAIGHAPPRLLPWGALRRETTRWRLACLSPTQTHRLAVCVREQEVSPSPPVTTSWLDLSPGISNT
jgi:4'-phosphopantetheinyl transferase